MYYMLKFKTLFDKLTQACLIFIIIYSSSKQIGFEK